jgi:hypothetical protein
MTVFDFQPNRGAGFCTSLIYFPSEEYVMYHHLDGCDAASIRFASKIKGSYVVNGKEYFNCYKFTSSGKDANIIISYGVGVIFEESPGYERTLLEYKLNN